MVQQGTIPDGGQEVYKIRSLKGHQNVLQKSLYHENQHPQDILLLIMRIQQVLQEQHHHIFLEYLYANSNITPYRTWEQVMESGSSGFAPFTADTSIETGKHITPTYGKKQNDVGGLPDSNTQIIEQPETAVGEAGLRKPGETFKIGRAHV